MLPHSPGSLPSLEDGEQEMAGDGGNRSEFLQDLVPVLPSTQDEDLNPCMGSCMWEE